VLTVSIMIELRIVVHIRAIIQCSLDDYDIAALAVL